MWGWSSNRPKNTNTNIAGNNTTQYPAQRASPITRTKHLESFLQNKTLANSILKPLGESEPVFDVIFTTRMQSTLALRIHIPKNVSTSGSAYGMYVASNGDKCPCPKMSLSGVTVIHPWVDQEMRVTGYSFINNETAFEQSRKLLGQMVQDVVEHFQFHPPEIIEFTDKNLEAMNNNMRNNNLGNDGKRSDYYPSGRNSNSSSISAQQRHQEIPPRHSSNNTDPPCYRELAEASIVGRQESLDYHLFPTMPTVPNSFNHYINDLSLTELDTILNNGTAFIEFLKNKMGCTDLPDEMMEQNLQAAKEHIEKRQSLEKDYEIVSGMKSILDDLKLKYDGFKTTYDSMNVAPTNHAISKVLRTARAEAKSQSEAIFEKFRSNEISTEEFVREFMKTRELFHERSGKIERLQS